MDMITAAVTFLIAVAVAYLADYLLVTFQEHKYDLSMTRMNLAAWGLWVIWAE